MRWVWRAESGAGAIEYGALVVLAGVIVAALITAGLPSGVTPAVSAAVCELYSAEHCKPENGGPGGPDGPGASGAPDGGSGDPTAAPGATQPADSSSSGDPELDGKIDKAQKEYDRLLKEFKKLKLDAGSIDDKLLELMKELLGVEDAKKCFTEGDIIACLKTALTSIGPVKAIKFASKIPKAYKLFKSWRKTSKAFDKAKGKLDRQKKKLDDLKKKRDRQGSCPVPNSFLPGTPVLLANGAERPIEDVRTGDRVLAFDPRTGREGPRPVERLIKGSGHKSLVRITITDDSGGSGTLTATDAHPFWAPETAAWVDAEDVRPGTRLRTDSGSWATATSVDHRTAADQQVHNLSIAGIQTYYVAVGDTAVLVHNKGCPTGPDGRKQASKDINDAVKNGKADDARKIVDQAEDAAKKAQDKAKSNPTRKNKREAREAQKFADRQKKKVVDAQVKESLRSASPQVKNEGVAADVLKKDRVDFNKKHWDGKRQVGEVDVETKKAIVEVASGDGLNKGGQLKKLVQNKQINPKGKPVIVYAPSASKNQIADMEKLNPAIKVVKDQKGLKDYHDSLS